MMDKADKPRRKLRRPEPGDRIRFVDGTIYRVREDGAWVKMPAGNVGGTSPEFRNSAEYPIDFRPGVGAKKERA
jgi:hypothetical protein